MAHNMISNLKVGDKYTDDEKDLMLMALLIHDGLKSGNPQEKYTRFDHPILMADYLMDCEESLGLEVEEIEFLGDVIKTHMGVWTTDYNGNEVLEKPGKPTDEEYELIKKHPKLGYEMLKHQNIDPHVRKAALMHHERCDGSGYPSGLEEDFIDEYAMIVGIADVYDAMTAARSYRAPLCPFQVISNFEKEGYQKYHAKYIITFLKQIAATYQSNRVVLSDGRGCNIVMLNQNALSRPMVQFDDNTILDLSTQKDLYIKSVL